MIALDVLGGDFAPDQIVRGACHAARSGVAITLFGPETQTKALLDACDGAWTTYGIKIVHAPDAVGMDEEPVTAVRKKPQSSLVQAVAAVAKGDADAVVSAGNSGALMAAAALIIGRQSGVERPAIATQLPSATGNVLVLDVGANTECRAIHLVQFAHLASNYLRTRGLSSPRVALLSNGHEPGKGSLLVKETHELLATDTSINFVGNVEPYDLHANKTDIVVCDGFAGNVLLKTIEAMYQLFMHWGKQFTHHTPESAPIMAAFSAFCAKKSSLHEHGGALLLGIKKPVIVCHGAADQNDILRALLFAQQQEASWKTAAAHQPNVL